MSTLEPEQEIPAAGSGMETRVRFVETLAGLDDAWITITDAARITRTSEAMARRWVASGRLPIKRQPAGINQQTRLVRLSDVAAIRPIIDPTAAISDEIHKLDLPSIPRQQAQIMQNHERLQQQVLHEQQAAQELRQDLQALSAHQQQAEADLREQSATRHEAFLQQLMQVHQQHERFDVQLREQDEIFQDTVHHLADQVEQIGHDLAELKTTLLERFTHWQHEMEQRLLAFDQQQRQQHEQLHSGFLALLQQHQEHFHARLTVLEETLTHLTQKHEQLEHAVATQYHAFTHEQEQLHALIEQHIQEVAMTLEQQEASQKHEVRSLYERLSQLEQWREHYAAQAYEQRVVTQEQHIQALTAMFLEEREARQVLGNQLEAQQQHLESLRRAIEAEGRRHQK